MVVIVIKYLADKKIPILIFHPGEGGKFFYYFFFLPLFTRHVVDRFLCKIYDLSPRPLLLLSLSFHYYRGNFLRFPVLSSFSTAPPIEVCTNNTCVRVPCLRKNVREETAGLENDCRRRRAVYDERIVTTTIIFYRGYNGKRHRVVPVHTVVINGLVAQLRGLL